MKLKIIFITFIFLMLVSSISFSKTNLEKQVDKELKSFADTIDEDFSIANKVEIVYNYLEQEIDFVEYFYSREYALTWYEKQGDCNDKVLLSMIILDYLNITTRPVYGYVKEYNYGWANNRHAWLEYYNGTEWTDIEGQFFVRMVKIDEHPRSMKMFNEYKNEN